MNRRVRVLQMIDFLGPGGAEALLYTLACSINIARFDLHICGLRNGSPYALGPQLRALGVQVVEFKQRNAYDLPTLFALIKYIRKHRIDIIHTHLLASDIMGRVAGFLTGKPVVSTVHNSREDFDHEPLRRQWMERWTARLMCRRLVVVSETLLDEIAEWYGLPAGRFLAISNGVDTERFRPNPEVDKAAVERSLFGEDGCDGPLVLSIARLTPQKGLNYLLEAAHKVLAVRPDVRFAIAGLGALQEELESHARSLRLDGKLVFAGARTDIPELLAASDLFVLSSLWEGLPIALLEAMSAGCPVVATEVGGVTEVVQRGALGLLSPPADPDALAEAILRALDDPQATRARGEAARAWVKAHYSMEAWVGKLERLYMRELTKG